MSIMICPCCGGKCYGDSIGYKRILWRCYDCPFEIAKDE